MTNTKEYNSNYYQKNRDKILLKFKEPQKCEICYCIVSRTNMWHHMNSKKHKKNSSPEYAEKFNEINKLKQQLDKLFD